MKAIFGFLGSVVFIVLFLLLNILVIAKFRLLDSNFWINKYDINFYEKITLSLNQKQNDFILPPPLLKELVDKNINNTTSYLNGQSTKLLVQLPESLGINFPGGNEIPADLLLSRYTPLGNDALIYISYMGSTGFYLSIAIAVLSVVLVLLIILLKNISGILLIISSIVLVLISGALEFIKAQWIRDLIPKNEAIALIGVPIINDISLFWFYTSLTTLLAGIAIQLFILYRKPKTN